MPRKRLEDELRDVWNEWSAPPDYGLWHEHKKPTTVEQLEEAVGLTEGQEEAPEPVAMRAGGGAGSASASAPLSPAQSSVKRSVKLRAVAEKFSKKLSPAPVLREKLVKLRREKEPEYTRPKTAPVNIEAEAEAVRERLKEVEPTAKVQRAQGDTPEIGNRAIQADLAKGLESAPLPGMTHKTKQNKGGYIVNVVTDPTDAKAKPKYYWYKDAAGSVRKLQGKSLQTAQKQFLALVDRK